MSFDLLVIDQYNKLDIHPSALTVKAIADLWNGDRSKDKHKALSELAYIYWMCYWQSSYYKGYTDLQERHNAVISYVFEDISWYPTLEVTTAMKIYEQLQEEAYPALAHLKTARKTLESLKKFLDTLDPGDTTKSGGLVLKPAEIYTAISKMGEALVAVEKMEDRVKKELQLETQKIKGGGKAGSFEDADNLEYLKE